MKKKNWIPHFLQRLLTFCGEKTTAIIPCCQSVSQPVSQWVSLSDGSPLRLCCNHSFSPVMHSVTHTFILEALLKIFAFIDRLCIHPPVW